MNIIQTDDKLDNCPCCGARADLIIVRQTRGEAWRDADFFKVSCSKCSLRTCQVASKATARKAWNRRVDKIVDNRTDDEKGYNTQYGWY